MTSRPATCITFSFTNAFTDTFTSHTFTNTFTQIHAQVSTWHLNEQISFCLHLQPGLMSHNTNQVTQYNQLLRRISESFQETSNVSFLLPKTIPRRPKLMSRQSICHFPSTHFPSFLSTRQPLSDKINIQKTYAERERENKEG